MSCINRIYLQIRDQSRNACFESVAEPFSNLYLSVTELKLVFAGHIAAVGGGGVVWLARFLCHHVRHTHSDQTSNDKDHASPLEPGQSAAEEDGGEDASEDDDSSSQHLEGAGVGEGQTNVLDTGGGHVTQSWRQEYL